MSEFEKIQYLIRKYDVTYDNKIFEINKPIGVKEFVMLRKFAKKMNAKDIRVN